MLFKDSTRKEETAGQCLDSRFIQSVALSSEDQSAVGGQVRSLRSGCQQYQRVLRGVFKGLEAVSEFEIRRLVSGGG